MRIGIFIPLLAGALISLTQIGKADAVPSFTDGNHLYDLCSTNETFCAAYVGGVVDAYFMTGLYTNDYQKGALVCLPPNATLEQLTDIVTKYLTEHPETRQYVGASEVGAALGQAFPCQ